MSAAILCWRTVGRTAIRCGVCGPAAATLLRGGRLGGGGGGCGRWLVGDERDPAGVVGDAGPRMAEDARRRRCCRGGRRQMQRMRQSAVGGRADAAAAAAVGAGAQARRAAGQIVAIDVIVAVPAEQLVHGRFGKVLAGSQACQRY